VATDISGVSCSSYIHHHIFYHGGAPLESLLSRSLIKTTAAAAGSACLYQQVKDIAPLLNDISNDTLCAATSIEYMSLGDCNPSPLLEVGKMIKPRISPRQN